MPEILIVGAGPAGTAAAVTLARAGRSVLVVDKARFPRDKCCGDGLTTLALRELETLGLAPVSVPNWQTVEGAWLRSPSGREVHVPLEGRGTFAAVAPRVDLDAALVDLARRAGAEVVEGCALTGSVRTDSRGVEVDLDLLGSRRFAHLIAADGMWSPVRKALGLTPPGYLGEWHAMRQYLSGVTGPAAERLYVWFEQDLLPGYAWSFPLPGGRVNLGFGLLRDGSRRTGEMKAQWADLLARPHVVAALGDGAVPEDRPTAWPIPARIHRATLQAGPVLFTGDAAGATDLLTGEGIGQALLTGRLAAEAILGSPGAPGPAYARAVRHHLRADHAMSATLGRVLRSERGARAAIRVIDGSGHWGRSRFARWMFEDEPRAVILTPRRWHRRFLTRDGAWVASVDQ